MLSSVQPFDLIVLSKRREYALYPVPNAINAIATKTVSPRIKQMTTNAKLEPISNAQGHASIFITTMYKKVTMISDLNVEN
jgi:hypothetical protein